jgi:hypothetical protein
MGSRVNRFLRFLSHRLPFTPVLLPAQPPPYAGATESVGGMGLGVDAASEAVQVMEVCGGVPAERLTALTWLVSGDGGDGGLAVVIGTSAGKLRVMCGRTGVIWHQQQLLAVAKPSGSGGAFSQNRAPGPSAASNNRGRARSEP